MKFSVIVPVYGVEKYLDECVASFLNQTYTDFELILVDDRSPDNCPKMCDGYAESDRRVRVIHKPQNEGLGFARNSGIEAALGDYIIFADSDDTVDLNMLKECSEQLADQPDILVYGMKLCYENKSGKTVRTEELTPENFFADTTEGMAEMFRSLSKTRVFQYACNKAYRREFVQNISTRFEKTKLIEDFLYNIEVFGLAESARSINKVFYFYRKPTHVTLASSYNPQFFELAKRKFLLEENFLKAHGAYHGECLQQVLTGHIKHFVSAVIRNHSKSANLSKKEQERLVLSMIDDHITQNVLEAYQPQGILYTTIVKMIKKRQVERIVLLCPLAELVQQKIRPLFKKIKR